MMSDPKTEPIPAPDPATPTVAAPAPMNLAAESMSCLVVVVCMALAWVMARVVGDTTLWKTRLRVMERRATADMTTWISNNLLRKFCSKFVVVTCVVVERAMRADSDGRPGKDGRIKATWRTEGLLGYFHRQGWIFTSYCRPSVQNDNFCKNQLQFN